DVDERELSVNAEQLPVRGKRAHVEERLGSAAFDVRERGAGGERERQRPPGDAPVEREQKPEQADERGGEQDRAGRVEPAQLPTERRSRPRRVGRQDAGGKRERERDQRQVDDEDRPPALPADEVAAER